MKKVLVIDDEARIRGLLATKQDMKARYQEQIAHIRAAYDERVKQLQKAAA
jgi:hypothetical protein